MSRDRYETPVWLVVTVFSLMLCAGGFVYLWASADPGSKPKANAPRTDQTATNEFSPAPSVFVPVKLPSLEVDTPVDENLFLLRTIEYGYNLSFNASDDLNTQLATIQNIRSKFTRLRMGVESNPQTLDPDLITAIKAFDSVLAAYQTLTQDLATIASDTDSAAASDRSASGGTALNTGLNAFDFSSNYTETTGQAAAWGLLAAGLHYAVDDYQRSEQRNQARTEAQAAAITRFEQKSRPALNQLTHTASEMSARHGWTPREAEFGFSQGDVQQAQARLQPGDIAAHVLHLEALALRHPKDPYIKARLYRFKANDPSQTPRQIADMALKTYALQTLVPVGHLYDDYRQMIVAWGAEVASVGRFLQYDLNQSVHRSTYESRVWVRLEEELRAMNPDDITGMTRRTLAQALLCDGQYQRAGNMLQAIEPLLRNDAFYQLWRAYTYSRNNDEQAALRWLRVALGSYVWDLSSVKASPHLSWLKRKRPNEVKALFTPTISWSVSDDWILDDIQITNTSAFVLTNLSLEFTLRQGSRVETCTLSLDWLGPGQSYVFPDAVNGVNGEWDMQASSVTWHCDQVN